MHLVFVLFYFLLFFSFLFSKENVSVISNRFQLHQRDLKLDSCIAFKSTGIEWMTLYITCMLCKIKLFETTMNTSIESVYFSCICVYLVMLCVLCTERTETSWIQAAALFRIQLKNLALNKKMLSLLNINPCSINYRR